jgi:hypothetical protein
MLPIIGGWKNFDFLWGSPLSYGKLLLAHLAFRQS